jgi:Bacterial Ig domain
MQITRLSLVRLSLPLVLAVTVSTLAEAHSGGSGHASSHGKRAGHHDHRHHHRRPDSHRVTSSPAVTWTTPKVGGRVFGQLDERAHNCIASARSRAGIDHVSFYRNGKLLNTRRHVPYSCVWDTTKVADGGSYTLRAVAYDKRGNSGSASVKVKVHNARLPDTTAPETTITAGPSGTINSSSASFSFSSSEAGSSLQCRLDAGSWASCSSPKAYSGLADGAHTFDVRATDAAGNPDATPDSRSFTVDIPPPPSGDGAIPGTGAVLRQDLVTNPDPVPLWRKIESAYPQQDDTNPQVLYRSGDGDPRPAIGQASPSAGYRRLFTTQGRQSLYDQLVGNNGVRTQLISNSNTNTFYPVQTGSRYVIYLSVRFQGDTSLPSDRLADDTQVWQMKNTGPGVGRFIISMTETQNTLYLKRIIDGTSTVWNLGGFKRGVWTRIAIDIKTSPDPSQGKMQVWGELNGDPGAQLVPMTDMLTLKTAYDADEIGKFSIGPYQPMSLPAVSRDYANIQICDWVAP